MLLVNSRGEYKKMILKKVLLLTTSQAKSFKSWVTQKFTRIYIELLSYLEGYTKICIAVTMKK